MGKSVLFLILLLAVSVRTQTRQCPGELSIFPCLCYIFEGRPSIQCAEIADEDQLEDIFSADFPEPDLQFFTLLDSSITYLTRNVFGNVTFNEVLIFADRLHEISEDAFENSIETLVNFDVANAPITQFTFPFESLGNYPQLVAVIVRNNLITQFPAVSSEYLRFFSILDNTYLTNVPADALASVGNLTSLDLEGCGITALDIAAFRGADQLEYLRLRSNSIPAITNGIFSYLPNILEIDLSNNEISSLANGAVTNLPSLVELDLGNNNLQAVNVGEFALNPALEIITLLNNQIISIAPGTFDNIGNLELVDLGFNNLTSLPTDTFRGANVTSIYVDNNAINYIEANAFGAAQDSVINIMENLMTNVYEYWLQPLLDAGNYVTLNGNQITCGCEISWLFSDPTYQDNVLFRCSNGSYFATLDPDYYLENCP